MTPPRNPFSGGSKRSRIDDLAASTARRHRGGSDDARGSGGSGDSPDGSSGGGTAVLIDDAGAVDDEKGVSLIAGAWQRLRHDYIFLAGLVIVTIFVVLAVIAPWIAPHDPGKQLLLDQIRQQTNPIPDPQPGFPLGGDAAGRDLLSRVLVGARQTLIVGVMATLGGLAGGVTLGTLAGAFGGWVDAVVMRIVDVMLSIPSLLMAFSIAAIFASATQWTVILAIAIVQVPIFARLLRGSMLAQRHSDHVLAARSLGVRTTPIVLRHMLPNAIGPVIVQATLVLATAIIDAAALSFLGLGSPDDTVPEWGQMLGRAQDFFNTEPHLAVWPAMCIIVVALGFTLMGESLREALDPKSRR